MLLRLRASPHLVLPFADRCGGRDSVGGAHGLGIHALGGLVPRRRSACWGPRRSHPITCLVLGLIGLSICWLAGWLVLGMVGCGSRRLLPCRRSCCRGSIAPWCPPIPCIRSLGLLLLLLRRTIPAVGLLPWLLLCLLGGLLEALCLAKAWLLGLLLLLLAIAHLALALQVMKPSNT